MHAMRRLHEVTHAQHVSPPTSFYGATIAATLEGRIATSRSTTTIARSSMTATASCGIHRTAVSCAGMRKRICFDLNTSQAHPTNHPELVEDRSTPCCKTLTPQALPQLKDQESSIRQEVQQTVRAARAANGGEETHACRSEKQGLVSASSKLTEGNKAEHGRRMSDRS